MRVLLVNPWVTDLFELGYWTKPIGLLYAGAFLAARGHQVGLVDCMHTADPDDEGELTSPGALPNRPRKIRAEVIAKPEVLARYRFDFKRHGLPVERFEELVREQPQPDVVLVGCTMTYWYHGAFEAIRRLRELLPGVPIALGGVYAKLCTRHARAASGADRVITGSLPREVVAEVEELGGETGAGPIAGDDFADWPEPLWELYEKLPVAVTMTSIGCPLRCSACASYYLSRGYARRPADAAAEEVLRLARRGAGVIGFMDDALLVDSAEYALPMFRQLAEAGAPAKLKTPNGIHVSAVTPELAQAMWAGGVDGLALSIETIIPERMRTWSQKTSMDGFQRAVEALREAGFTRHHLVAYVMFGLPGQGIEESIATRDFVASCGVEPRIVVFTPVPRTTEFMRAVEVGMIEADGDPVLHNNKLRALDYFEHHPDQRAAFRDLFSIVNPVAGLG